jgi:hypothetical protein
MLFAWAWGKMIMKKTGSKKSRDTVPFMESTNCFYSWYGAGLTAFSHGMGRVFMCFIQHCFIWRPLSWYWNQDFGIGSQTLSSARAHRHSTYIAVSDLLQKVVSIHTFIPFTITWCPCRRETARIYTIPPPPPPPPVLSVIKVKMSIELTRGPPEWVLHFC